ncbi:MAG: protein kinase [Proteobacteria bacterium]|nr:protein kinase [Pseudomonadota bacterium]
MLYPFGMKRTSIGEENITIPSFTRIPDKLNDEDFIPFIEGLNFIPLKTYKYIRTLQLLANLNHAPLNNLLFSEENTTILELPHRIMISTDGELIAFIERSLGSGTFGKVYIGFNVDTSEFVAIKQFTFNRDYENHQDFLLKIKNEKEALQSINAYIGQLSIEETLFNTRQQRVEMCVMSMAWGENVENLLDAKLLSGMSASSFTPKLEIGLKALIQLFLLHKRNIIHRDFKCNNIIWDPISKTATIVDFGAYLLKKEEVDLNDKPYSNVFVSYAPELYFEYRREFSLDVYAAGVVLLQIFSRTYLYSLTLVTALVNDILLRTYQDGILFSLVDYADDVLIDSKFHSKAQKAVYSLIRQMLQAEPVYRAKLERVIFKLARIYAQQCIHEKAINNLIEVLSAFPRLALKKYEFNNTNQDILKLLNYVFGFVYGLPPANGDEFIKKYKKDGIYDLLFACVMTNKNYDAAKQLLNAGLVSKFMQDQVQNNAKERGDSKLITFLNTPDCPKVSSDLPKEAKETNETTDDDKDLAALSIGVQKLSLSPQYPTVFTPLYQHRFQSKCASVTEKNPKNFENFLAGAPRKFVLEDQKRRKTYEQSQKSLSLYKIQDKHARQKLQHSIHGYPRKDTHANRRPR